MSLARSRPAVPVAELLGAPDLRLRLVTGPPDLDEITVGWCSATELVDPARFLEGNELMLITGEELAPDDSDGMHQYVSRLAYSGIRAIGFGVGLRHSVIPRHLIAHCAALGVALLEVPRGVPFGAISRFVADEVASQEYSAVRHTMGVHDQLVKALTDGAGLSAMMESLGGITGAECAIVDFYGSVLAESSPLAAATFPVHEVVERRQSTEPWQDDSVFARPILLRGQPIATLLTRAASLHEEAIEHAIGLIALELAHRSEIQVIRREAFGLVLEDVFAGELGDGEAAKKLAGYGLGLDVSNTVMVASAHRSSEAMLSSPWNLQVELRDPDKAHVLVAAVRRDLVVITADPSTAPVTARRLADRLRPFVGQISIGIGNAYLGVGGLRLSYLEACAAASSDLGVIEAGPPRIANLMVATAPPAVSELADRILNPLVEHDARHGGDLVKTLEVLLEEDGSSGRAADRLFLHRNTIGQRIAKIRDLTGCDPTSVSDATELLLALAHRSDP